ncbi:RNase adapter RapZ [Actinospongicola halichondriae]|uniref:RNase adapter RapZ n=1 Tax=Actinospongicola halichondriae TaxID=3236844 RepID=UPI003D3D64F9
MSDYVVIAGLSGAGRSQAANDFEDLGWFVIDNLPPALMSKVSELADAKGSVIERVALVAGTGHYDSELLEAIADLRRTVPRVRILFLDCATPELVRRYEQTRRRHPLSTGDTLEDAIEAERSLLEPVRADADVVVDTTELNVHQLRDRVRAAFGQPDTDVGMQTAVRSFGFKHGLPLDADLVFDVRFLPNPHWVDELRPLTGLDAAVRDHVLESADAGAFLDHLTGLFELLLPAYRREGKAYLSIAIGCTGGRHRSVAISEELGRRIDALGTPVSVSHRDIER